MILSHLATKKVILASKSPRRQELLKGLGITFEVRTKEVDESYSSTIKNEKVAEYLAQKKSAAFKLNTNEILLTADTIVVLGNNILNKPKDFSEAEEMLTLLSGKTHQVITGVCIKSLEKEAVFSSSTKVQFKPLSITEIKHYINSCQPFDKAGAYGIQEWIGYIGIEKLEGCYYNVMGLPLSDLYQELQGF